MNEKVNLQDLSSLLAEKGAITKKEAELFLRECFEVMSDTLFNDKSLKIKDLGVFKLSLMEDRESIDVTTGERMLIPAHYKVIFTPDKKLAEEINEPFAFFETMEIENESNEKKEEVDVYSEEELEEEENENHENNEENESSEEKEGVDACIEEELGKAEKKEEIIPEEKSVSEESTGDKEVVIPKEEKNSRFNFYSENKILCLNCREIEAHRAYRKKYYKTLKKLHRMQLTTYLLILLLLGALGYIFYQTKAEVNNQPKIVVIPQSVSSLDTVPKISALATDSVHLTNNIVKEEDATTVISPKVSGESKQTVIAPGQRLTSIAEKEYGNKVFWIYIYLENKAVISNPNVVPVGIKITIPPADKYGIDKDNPASVKKAKEVAMRHP